MDPTQAPKDTQEAVALHRLVRPFARTETARWRERDEIRNAISELYQSLASASENLEMDDKLQDRLEEASRELYDAERAIERLWPNSLLSGETSALSPATKGKPESKPYENHL